jgi:hypothetical protein
MRTLVTVIAAAAIALLCSSCATVTRGTTDQMQILSEPPAAEARTSMGFVCTTPCTLQVGREDEFTVTISKPGYQPARVAVSTKVNTGGGAAFAGNVPIGGIVGMAADASTGTGLDHYPNPVEVDLVPLKPTRSIQPKSSPQAGKVQRYRRWDGDDRA